MISPEQQPTSQPEPQEPKIWLPDEAREQLEKEEKLKSELEPQPEKPKLEESSSGTEKKKPSIEIVTDIGRERTPEEVEEFKKIREEAKQYIEKQKEAENREKEIREKQKRGELLSSQEVAYLRARELAQEKEEAEKKAKEEEEKEREAREKAKVEAAKNELVDLAKSINEAREKKKREEEISLYDRAKEVFKEATGESLDKIASERAKKDAEEQGYKIITKQEFFSEARINRTQEEMKIKRWVSSVNERWLMLSEEEKKRYENDIRKFHDELEEKRKKLGETLKVSISENVFYDMMRRGYKPEDIKKRGIFGGKIEIPSSDGRRPLVISKKEFSEQAEQTEHRIDKFAKGEAEEELNRKFLEGHRKWENLKHKHMRDIIKERVVEQKPEGKSIPEGPSVVETRKTREVGEAGEARETGETPRAEKKEKIEKPETKEKPAERLINNILDRIEKEEAKRAPETKEWIDKAKGFLRKTGKGLLKILGNAVGELMIFVGSIIMVVGKTFRNIGRDIEGRRRPNK